MTKTTFGDATMEEIELYDTRLDPFEDRPVVDTPQQDDVKTRLLSELYEYAAQKENSSPQKSRRLSVDQQDHLRSLGYLQ